MDVRILPNNHTRPTTLFVASKIPLFVGGSKTDSSVHQVVRVYGYDTVIFIRPNPSSGGNLWKHLLQNRQIHPKHSSELLVGGVVAEVHMAGGVDLLLCAELRGSLD